ncbi:hypothetical protein [Marinifilum flexuosum]|uniref:Uncharacterized protein n=1 Tax=Marinifilum flexuosum TaxID=1117708 RepID=A0A419WMT4_9BACT|nr:hypothetical protein [Marinifilum flexuosum]RKD96767.1 hypothetical protein BXY64_3714 [Marinifilum flexuosum]
MYDKLNKSVKAPSLATRKEVFESAHANIDFFESFSDALEHAWKFYKK